MQSFKTLADLWLREKLTAQRERKVNSPEREKITPLIAAITLAKLQGSARDPIGPK